MQWFENSRWAQCRQVEIKKVGTLIARERREMGHIPVEMLGEIMQHRPAAPIALVLLRSPKPSSETTLK